jgi:hypothetical protein
MENKKLISTTVFAKSAGKTTLVNGDKQKTLALKQGQRIIINW